MNTIETQTAVEQTIAAIVGLGAVPKVKTYHSGLKRGPDESLMAYETRLRERKNKQLQAQADRREAKRIKAVDIAQRVWDERTRDFVLVVSDAKFTEQSRIRSNAYMPDKAEIMSQVVLSTESAGEKRRELLAVLTAKFKPFSKPQGRVKGQWRNNKQLTKALQHASIYHEILTNSPWKISRAIPPVRPMRTEDVSGVPYCPMYQAELKEFKVADTRVRKVSMKLVKSVRPDGTSFTYSVPANSTKPATRKVLRQVLTPIQGSEITPNITADTATKPAFQPSNMEVYTQSERLTTVEEYRDVTITAKDGTTSVHKVRRHAESVAMATIIHSITLHARHVLGKSQALELPYLPCKDTLGNNVDIRPQAAVLSPVTLLSQYPAVSGRIGASGRYYSVYPRVSSAR